MSQVKSYLHCIMTLSGWLLKRRTTFLLSTSPRANFCKISDKLFKMLLHCYFLCPGLKGPPGASSNRIVCPSVCLSVCLSVRNSVPLTNKVQYLKFGWSYSNQTWTVSKSKGCSHSHDIICPLGWGGVKMWDLEILPDFNFVAAGGIRVSQTHV